jgi:thiol:disulfide interchange protein DsbG
MLRALVFSFLISVFSASLAAAETESLPPLPDTLKNLAAQGAQVRYLGREKGLDGWLFIQGGQEQFFYVTQDMEAVLMGVLFDGKGKMITVRQVQNLQQGNDPTLENLVLAKEDEMQPETAESAIAQLQEQLKKEQSLSPAQKLFASVEAANTVTLGKSGAPVIYAFLDPQCPHCHAFMEDIRKDYIEAGKIQIKMIPVGIKDDTKAQSAVLLASADPQGVWFRHLDGDETALPVSKHVNLQAVEHNLSIMHEWKLDATPTIIYKTSDGEIKIIRGKPKNMNDLMNDLN